MNTLNWENEQRRFMTIVYPNTIRAAKRAFHYWHESKQSDAVQECLAKMWDQWTRLLIRGKNPEPMLPGLIKYALLWVKYDRRLSGRSRNPDLYDYRSGFSQHLLSEQGQAFTSERGSCENAWINWDQHTGDNPALLASALEQTGISLAQWCDL